MKVLPLLLIGIVLFEASCKTKGCTDETASNFNPEAKKEDGSCVYDTTPIVPPIDGSSDVMGYSILAKLPGIWNGPVTSPTPLGSFAEWIVDFRPIAPAQVSEKMNWIQSTIFL